MRTIFFKISICLSFLLLVSCSGEKKETPKEEAVIIKPDTLAIGNTVYNIQDLTDTNYVFPKGTGYHDSDDVSINKYPDLVTRIADTLFLKCDNGTIIKQVNNKSQDDSYQLFNFIELDKDINYYVISCLYVESMHVLLVNKKNGVSIETIGYPVVSPNKKTFICPNMDIEAGFTLNGLGLYRYKDTCFVLMGVREIYQWGPEEVMWKNDTTVIIKALQKNTPSDYKYIYKALFIK